MSISFQGLYYTILRKYKCKGSLSFFSIFVFHVSVVVETANLAAVRKDLGYLDTNRKIQPLKGIRYEFDKYYVKVTNSLDNI